jgi:hypothetical protein
VDGGRLQRRRYSALSLRSESFPGKFHITVPSLVLSRGPAVLAV